MRGQGLTTSESQTVCAGSWLRLNIGRAIIRRAPDCAFVDINSFLGLFDLAKAVAFAQRLGPIGLGHGVVGHGRGIAGPAEASARVLTGEFGKPILGSLLGDAHGCGTTVAGERRPRRPKERNDGNQTSWLSAVPQRPGGLVYGDVRIDPLFAVPDPGRVRARVSRLNLAPARPAYPSPGPDADRDCRLRGPARGGFGRGDPAGRRGVVFARREALARRGGNDGHDPYRRPGKAQRQGRRLDGKGDRRTISGRFKGRIDAAFETVSFIIKALPMATWTSDELNKIGGADELRITSLRRDGTLRKPVIIWVVRVGDHIYVRSAYGPTVAWLRGAKVRHEGRVIAGGVEKDVAFQDGDAAVNDQIDDAYLKQV